MYFLTLIFKNLTRRKLRTFLTGLGVAAAVGTMVALVGVASGFETAAFDTFKKRGEDIVVIAGGVPNQLSSDLNEDISKQIEKIPGVSLVTPGLIEIVSFHSYYVLVQGWEENNPAFNDFEITSGRLFNSKDKQVAILGSNVAYRLNKKIGDTVRIKGEEFTTAGIFHSFSVYDNDSIIVPIKDLQVLLGREHSVTGFSVVLKDSLDKQTVVNTVAKAISSLKNSEGAAHGLSALPTEEYISQSAHIRMIHAMAWITSAIALFIGVLNMANTMVMSVVERTREIGILRAIGWAKTRVIRMILGESLIISVVGGLAGIAAAVLACRWFPHLPQVGGFIQGDIAPSILMQGFGLAIIVGLIGGAWPALRAASLLPTEAIYHE